MHHELQVPNVSSSSNSDSQPFGFEKSRSGSKISNRVKLKSWYNVIYPSYKSRAEQFKKIFKDVPDDQRLIVGKFPHLPFTVVRFFTLTLQFCAFPIEIAHLRFSFSILNRLFVCFAT